jgi:hypothetical protein
MNKEVAFPQSHAPACNFIVLDYGYRAHYEHLTAVLLDLGLLTYLCGSYRSTSSCVRKGAVSYELENLLYNLGTFDNGKIIER